MLNFDGLLDPQKAHCLRLLNSIYENGCASDMSQTGTGKTHCASWVAKQLKCPVVVICPKVVMHIWRDTLAMFGITDVIIINYEKLMRGNTEYLTYDLNLFHSTNEWWLSNGVTINFRPDSFIIVDEEHKCRGQKSLNKELLLALKNRNYKKLGLSATAATSVADMKAYGYNYNLHGGHDYIDWCRENGAEIGWSGNISWDGEQTLAREGMRSIHVDLFETQKISSRMLRSEFGSIFPDNQLIAEVFDLGANTRKLQRAYEDMQDELYALDARAENYSQHIFAIMMKARRSSELLKIPAMVEWIEDNFDEGMSPVVFVNFTDTVDAITARLSAKKYKGKIGYLVGSQTDDEKTFDQREFQSDRKRIFIANQQAGNLGINLHDLHGIFARRSLINPSWSAINFAQATGRIHRANGKTPCVQRFMYANVPIEIKMAERMVMRLDNLDMLNDGDVSMDFVL